MNAAVRLEQRALERLGRVVFAGFGRLVLTGVKNVSANVSDMIQEAK